MEAFDTNKPAEIAKRLKITYQGAKNYLDGRLPSVEKLLDIANSTGYSIHWLLTGEGQERVEPVKAFEPGQVPIYFGPYEQQVIKEIGDADGRTFEQEVRDIVLEELKKRGYVGDVEPSNLMFFGEPVRSVELPLMGWIAAGEPIHLVAQQEKVRVPDFMMKPGKQHFVLHVRGDSMVDDHIPDGSLIICESRKTAIDGERVVAVIDGESATVKRIYHESDRIRLQPANPLHKPIYLRPEQDLEIQGVVVAVFHK